MRLLAVDPGWSPATCRVAAAWCATDGVVRWGCPPVAGHAELVEWISGWAAGCGTPAEREPGQLRVGLDIPLSLPAAGAFRPVEVKLRALGISPLPSHRAGAAGGALRRALVERGVVGPAEVLEIFPFAVYRVLDWLRAQPGGLGALAGRSPLVPGWKAALRRHRHRQYKRVSGDERRAALAALADLLQEPVLGWRIPMPLPRPGDLALDRLTDLYDALLGLLPMWLRYGRNHPWARCIGEPGEEILVLLPDQESRVSGV